MQFNYSAKKDKFTKEWEKLRKEYAEAGMSDSDIEEMYKFDLQVFRRDRTECRHTQPLMDSGFDSEDTQGDSMSVLLQKFQTELSVCDKHCFQNSQRFSWIEEIENDELYLKIIALSESDIDLITLIAFEGYSQREVAQMRGITPTAICKTLRRLRKSLKDEPDK